MVDGRNHPANDRAPDPLGVLRRSVDDLHQAVDERSLLGSVGLDVHRYGMALVALARVLPGVEQALIRSGGDRLPISPIATLLADDVRALGLDAGRTDPPVGRPGYDDAGRTDPPVGRPGYDDAGAWWGAAYVLQGSRLGATVIAERLAADLPDVARTYFDAAATDAAPTWARFRVAARAAFCSGQADLGRATAAARAVFDSLLVEFDRIGLSPIGEGRVA